DSASDRHAPLAGRATPVAGAERAEGVHARENDRARRDGGRRHQPGEPALAAVRRGAFESDHGRRHLALWLSRQQKGGRLHAAVVSRAGPVASHGHTRRAVRAGNPAGSVGRTGRESVMPTIRSAALALGLVIWTY